MNKVCFGCGVKLQSEDETKQGYIPEAKREDAEYCQRCFKMIHYGVTDKAKKPKSTEAIISTVNKNAKFAVFMVDFIDIYDEVMNIYSKIKVPKILVVSKSDIIPRSISFSTIKDYLRKLYKVKEGIVFASMKSNLNTFLKEIYDKDDIYFLGLTNSGKSTMINMIASLMGTKAKELTTSFKENTTLDFLRIKIGGKTIVDSPGFVQDGYEVDKKTRITSEIHPITYQNKIACTYKVADAFQIRIEDMTNAVFYFGKNVDVERSYNKEVKGEAFKARGNSDIVISGLGFIKLTNGTKVVLSSDIIKYVHVRPSLVGGYHE